MLRTRAYRMKLEEWGMRKNKGPANLGKTVRPGLSVTTSAPNQSNLEPRSSQIASDLVTDGNAPV
jgi:hypothetical protein